ncbi:MAG: SPFH/Band 7/PHB domain protein, partial [Actinomycetota bacterium]|nr:SPFH/Band 7/PHB domain protein [Actinomycetota bacterium]
KAGRPTPELLAYQYLQTLPQMAQGDANKVWIVPSDFGKALEGFSKMLGAPGEDGVFRFEPSRDYVPSSRPEEDDEAIAAWFDTPTDPHVAAALRAAEEVARKQVPGPEVGMTPSLGGSPMSGDADAVRHVQPPQMTQPPSAAAPPGPVASPPSGSSPEQPTNNNSARPPDDGEPPPQTPQQRGS